MNNLLEIEKASVVVDAEEIEEEDLLELLEKSQYHCVFVSNGSKFFIKDYLNECDVNDNIENLAIKGLEKAFLKNTGLFNIPLTVSAQKMSMSLDFDVFVYPVLWSDDDNLDAEIMPVVFENREKFLKEFAFVNNVSYPESIDFLKEIGYFKKVDFVVFLREKVKNKSKKIKFHSPVFTF